MRSASLERAMRAGALLAPVRMDDPGDAVQATERSSLDVLGDGIAAPSPLAVAEVAPRPDDLTEDGRPEPAPPLAAGRGGWLERVRRALGPALGSAGPRSAGRETTAAVLARVEEQLATLLRRGEMDRDAGLGRMDRVEARLDALDAGLSHRLGALDGALQRVGAELQGSVAAARLPDEVLDGILIRSDAARLQVREARAVIGQASAEAVTLLQSIHPKADDVGAQVSALHGKADEVGAQISALHAKADDLGRQASALHAKLDGAGQERAALLERLDGLARRYFIPAGADVAVRTDEGYLVVPIEDEGHIAAMVETGGRLEPGTIAVACALAVEGGLAIDVGAHVGTFTLPLARRVGAPGQVIAVEPAPRTAGVLRRSLALNDLDGRVALHECAAGAVSGQALLHLAAMGSHNSLLPLEGEAAGDVAVALRPLDALVPAGRPACVLKIDAEGMELDVLRGAGRVLRDSPRLGVIAEFGPSHLERLGIGIAAWMEAFRALGLVPWEIDEETAALRPLRGAGLESVFSLNLLWLRDAPSSYPGLRVA